MLLWAAALVGLPIGRLHSQPTCADPRAAVSSSPGDEYAWIALGRCLLSAGLLEEAIEALRQAVQVAPGNTQTYDELGIAYVRAGLLREAWELYRRVQDCGIGTG